MTVLEESKTHYDPEEMWCPDCDHVYPPAYNYCPQCGTELHDTSERDNGDDDEEPEQEEEIRDSGVEH